MRTILTYLFALGFAFGVGAAEPWLEKVEVFQAGADGYPVYRIPGLVVTAKGTVLAFSEARRSSSDWGMIDIMMRRSLDGGKTWGPSQKIADIEGPKKKNPMILGDKRVKAEEITFNNPVAIADRDGTVHFLFCYEYMRCFYQRSDDDGLTWSKPQEITGAFEGFRSQFDWKVLAVGPGHGIQLKNGRLLAPVWISPGTGSGAHRPSVSGTIFSDDGGKNWKSSEVAGPNTAEWVIPNEAMAVQLADGGVMLNMRTESKAHQRLVTTSPDGATHWSTPQFDKALSESVCMASIERLSEKPRKNRILFSNPDNLSRADGNQTIVRRDRKNVSIKLSYDEAKTWPVSKVLEAGFSAYSDLAVLPDGTILCLYERGPGRSEFITLARFNLEWLTDGKDSYEVIK
jgi:sialidase-1